MEYHIAKQNSFTCIKVNVQLTKTRDEITYAVENWFGVANIVSL